MRRLLVVAGAVTLAWGGAAWAQDATVESDEVVALLASSIDEQRPLGSAPLIAVYILMAALGVRLAMRKPGRER